MGTIFGRLRSSNCRNGTGTGTFQSLADLLMTTAKKETLQYLSPKERTAQPTDAAICLVSHIRSDTYFRGTSIWETEMFLDALYKTRTWPRRALKTVSLISQREW